MNDLLLVSQSIFVYLTSIWSLMTDNLILSISLLLLLLPKFFRVFKKILF